MHPRCAIGIELALVSLARALPIQRIQAPGAVVGLERTFSLGKTSPPVGFSLPRLSITLEKWALVLVFPFGFPSTDWKGINLDSPNLTLE